jgi:predicted DNA-binding transcriptional regulator YafY
MDLRSSSITADILNVLTDGKIHTMKEIAREVEVSESTVKRHIQSLSYRYPVETFKGGDKRGGVYLDKRYILQGHILTKPEIAIGAKIFKELKTEKFNEEELKALRIFKKIFLGSEQQA